MAQGYKIQWLSLFSTNPLSLNFVQNKLSDIADKMPVFISHGLQDPVLDHSKAMEVATLLETLDYKIQVHTFNGGHEISLDILQKWREFLGH
jgi:predicted esterase